MVEHFEADGRRFTAELSEGGPIPGGRAWVLTVEHVGGPPLTNAELRDMAERIAAELVRRGIPVHSWTIGDDGEAEAAAPPGADTASNERANTNGK